MPLPTDTEIAGIITNNARELRDTALAELTNTPAAPPPNYEAMTITTAGPLTTVLTDTTTVNLDLATIETSMETVFPRSPTILDSINQALSNIDTEEIPEPVFHLQQNTQAAELRELRDAQPQEIIHRDFSRLSFRALEAERSELKDYLHNMKRLVAAKVILHTTPPKYKAITLATLRPQYPSRSREAIEDINSNLKATRTYSLYEQAQDTYRRTKAEFLYDKARFAPQQAVYHQRQIMIRQKPRKNLTIQAHELMETISQWENVWGIGCKLNNTSFQSQALQIRVGLCNIIMSESATESRYDYEAKIKLAPFFITISLLEDGSFVCRSADNQTMGLSRSNNCGGLGYDIHPHQLSDSPCFGTFGQTLVDMAHKGEVTSLVSTLIGFYSQYNSQDSAGVSAQEYHPCYMATISHPPTYAETLCGKFNRFFPYNVIDKEKLATSIEDYLTYNNTERLNQAPERIDNIYCESCNDTCCNDGNGFFYDANDNRICPDCWNEHYCSGCDRHEEDCNCEPD